MEWVPSHGGCSTLPLAGQAWGEGVGLVSWLHPCPALAGWGAYRDRPSVACAGWFAIFKLCTTFSSAVASVLAVEEGWAGWLWRQATAAMGRDCTALSTFSSDETTTYRLGMKPMNDIMCGEYAVTPSRPRC